MLGEIEMNIDKEKLFDDAFQIVIGVHSNDPTASRIIAQQKLYDLIKPILKVQRILSGKAVYKSCEAWQKETGIVLPKPSFQLAAENADEPDKE